MLFVKLLIILGTLVYSSANFSMELGLLAPESHRQHFDSNLRIIDLLQTAETKWEQAEKKQISLKDKPSDQTSKQARSRISPTVIQECSASMLLCADALFCLFDAYDTGYEPALEEATKIHDKMTHYLLANSYTNNENPPKYNEACERLRKSRENRENLIEQIHNERKIILDSMPRDVSPPQTSRTIEMFNQGLFNHLMLMKKHEEFHVLRAERISNFLDAVRRSIQSFYCANQLGYPNAYDCIPKAAALLDVTKWHLSKTTTDLLKQTIKTLRRLNNAPISAPDSPSNPAVHPSITCSPNYDYTPVVKFKVSEDPLIQGVSAYNDAIKLKQFLNELKSRKNPDHAGALDMYNKVLRKLLFAYSKGYPRALDRAKDICKELQAYRNTLPDTVLIPLALKPTQELIDQQENSLNNFFEQIKQQKQDQILDESPEYLKELIQSMVEAFNNGIEFYFRAHNELEEHFLETPQKITDATNEALKAGEHFTLARYDGVHQALQKSKECEILLDQSHWNLTDAEIKQLLSGKERIEKELENNKYAPLVTKSYENAARKQKRKDAQLARWQDTLKTSQQSAAAAAIMTDDTSSSSSASSSRSNTSALSRRLKRLSGAFKESQVNTILQEEDNK